MKTPTAYPLEWPAGWPQTPRDKREKGSFQSTLPGALASLAKEVERLGGTGLILSSNYTLGVSSPIDPGVVAYFTYDKAQVAIPCDRWMKIEHNVRVIALTIEAMRGMERWGAKHMIKAMFSGFKALPAPADLRDWWDILECRSDSSREVAQANFRRLAKDCHPDNGGTDERMSLVNSAWERAKKERGWT